MYQRMFEATKDIWGRWGKHRRNILTSVPIIARAGGKKGPWSWQGRRSTSAILPRTGCWGPYGGISVKIDVNPNVRTEWTRARDAETAGKKRSKSVGCGIRIDSRDRKLYWDVGVIDKENSALFMPPIPCLKILSLDITEQEWSSKMVYWKAFSSGFI